jgi:hypothetical protein
MATRLAPSLVSCIAALVFSLTAFAQQAFTPKGVVQWGQGGDRERGMLTQMGYGQLTQGEFGLSVADLNGDNRPEILVLQRAACDSAGCPITALQSAGPGKVLQLFSQKVPGRLAITNEKVGAYNAFASADAGGTIMKDASGRPLVYPVGATAAAAVAAPAANVPAAGAPPAAASASAPAAAPPKPAWTASQRTTPPPPATVQAAPVAVAPAPLTDSQKAQAGIGQPDWRTPGAEYFPNCLYPKCLNLMVVEKSGIGTAAAKARGVVSREDATRWCATYKPADRFCVQNETESGGSAGGPAGPKHPVIEANCTTGTLHGVDGFDARYVGTWPADGPGAGRPRFDVVSYPGATFEQKGAVQLGGAWTIYDVATNRSSGEALAIQWEMLCKGAPPPAARP